MFAKPTISQYLSFFLTEKIQAMLPTEELGEIIKIDPSHIVPIFDLPSAIMGVYNHRGDVLWVVDMASLLGLPPLYKQNYYHSYNVLLIDDGSRVLGLAVRRVGQLVLCKTGQIRRTLVPDLSPKMLSCAIGEKRNAQGETIVALDSDRVMQLLSQEKAVKS